MIRLYRRLLYLYPTSFRAEYGDEMCALFAERSAGAGAVARVGLFLGAVADVVANAIGAHWEILIQDLRYTVRSLNRARGFALAASRHRHRWVPTPPPSPSPISCCSGRCRSRSRTRWSACAGAPAPGAGGAA
jgi:hypothetical protein